MFFGFSTRSQVRSLDADSSSSPGEVKIYQGFPLEEPKSQKAVQVAKNLGHIMGIKLTYLIDIIDIYVLYIYMHIFKNVNNTSDRYSIFTYIYIYKLNIM